jgi:GcrA cell cycle regulator
MRKNGWTQSNIDSMLSLKDEHSTQEIADIIGTTKNAVIGKLNRMKKMTEFSHLFIKKSKEEGITKDIKMKLKRKFTIKPATVIGEYSLSELAPKQCRFPHGDPKSPDFGFCGAEKHGRTYCKKHHDLCTRIIEKRSDKIIDRNW